MASTAAPAEQETPAAQAPAQISNSASKGFTYARVKDGYSVAASRSPGAPPFKRLNAWTEMNSRRHLPVVDVRGDWIAVAPTSQRNGERVWIERSSDDVTFVETNYSIVVDVSQRRLALRDGERVVMSARVAVGAPGSPTPLGRFAVTDKLNGRALASYYGCCLLALNAHQPNLPAGWKGGNRMAIHGTNSPGSIGQAASAGCVRLFDPPLRQLMDRVPLGTPVFIRA